MKTYLPTEKCTKCKGRCCRQMPGICHPDDIARMFPANLFLDSINKALKTKKFCIDWYEDSHGGNHYMRPSVKGSEGVVYHPAWYGECVFLTHTGCSLGFETRPFTCKTLKPSDDKECISSIEENEKLFMAKIWDKTDVDLRRLQIRTQENIKRSLIF